jgi:hypothetical protein
MNIQVANLASTTAIPVGALPAHLSVEPIIALVEAYRAGMTAYNAAPKGEAHFSSDGKEDALVAATYGPPIDQLRNDPPVIHSTAGAITALRFAKDETEEFMDPLGLGAIVGRVLEFLESAGGAAIVHPDAELLALGAQIDALTTRIEANCAFHNSLIEECDRQFVNGPDALVIGKRDRDWFGAQVTTRGNRWHPDDAMAVKTPRHVFVGTLDAAQKRAEELRRTGTAHMAAYEAWQERVGLNANEEEFCALAEQRAGLFRSALAIRPATLAGAVIQAKIVRLENYSLFKSRNDDEYDDGEKETVAFINNLLPAGSDQ